MARFDRSPPKGKRLPKKWDGCLAEFHGEAKRFVGFQSRTGRPCTCESCVSAVETLWIVAVDFCLCELCVVAKSAVVRAAAKHGEGGDPSLQIWRLLRLDPVKAELRKIA
jgi:hypothetical protein